ncbi:MAG: molecular chaperone TorD family protein [Myxococcota bacterium]|jgi:DMSO reductase family type II enzyme chaperone|nr:molecular chaperone TorD family protein [Myxococcota bacterium]
MNEIELVGLQGSEVLHAAARSRAFQVFAEAIAYPEGDLEELIGSGVVADALRASLTDLDERILEGVDSEALRAAGEQDDLAVEYTRLFDVGASGPPCPLHGGLYGGARMKVMEEAVRFYNHFGLHLSDDRRELPDHLQLELEFIHFLAFREAESLQAGEDPSSWRRAQRDFIARHPGAWVPKLRAKLAENDPPPYIAEVVRLLARTLEAEMKCLVGQTLDS